jgi:L-seryl-tRNA(Ser) seleniumtransferase
MISRRKLVHYLSTLPFMGGLVGSRVLDGDGAAEGTTRPPVLNPAADGVAHDPEYGYRDYFSELGLRTFINAAGTYTALTGSLMPKEVVEAWNYASRHYVELDAIQDKVGERIAELIGCEYATVSAGAFSAMTLGLAGVMCGMDEEKVAQLPDTTGLKDEVVMLKPPHPVGYVHALKNTGATIIEVETRRELEDAIGDKTAMLFVFNAYNGTDVEHEELVAAGKEHGIPTFNDCAADVPPVENLWKYTDMGYDLVAFSGGKDLKGPQSAGLLLGRRDLIEAARLHAPPRGNTIGRGMKVNKEDVLAMMVAVERFLADDHEAEWARWEEQIQRIDDAAGAVPGVQTEQYVPEVANHTPSLRITWTADRIAITPDEARQRLRDGHPSIETAGGSDSLNVTVWQMRPGEERIVARRIREVLDEASA